MPRKKVRHTERIEKKIPSKIRVRKDLNADALLGAIRKEFEEIPDFRTEDVDINPSDALMSAFAMFSLKDPLFLRFDKRRADETEHQNLRNIYGIEAIPSDSRMRGINDEM